MSSKPPALVPNALSMREALSSSAPLARLRDALRDSEARFAAIGPALPRALAAHVRPGPVDGEAWSVIAANAAVAAKLRQLSPHFEALLREAGWSGCTVRIKVSSRPSA